MKKVCYYEDERRDDFAGTRIKTKPLRENYRYLHTAFGWRLTEFLLYRGIGQPLVWLFLKLVHLQRFRNRRVLREAGARGLYFYGNHTNALLDSFVPSVAFYRRHTYILMGPDAMSIPGLNNLIEKLGGIPLGTTVRQKEEMVRCVAARIAQGGCVAIYPEAHIWPYCNWIRDFPAASFGYPARDGSPVYTLTNCYRKRLLGGRPRVVTWVDGPFYADASLPLPARKQQLRDQCRAAMCRRAAAESTCAYRRYLPKKRPPE